MEHKDNIHNGKHDHSHHDHNHHNHPTSVVDKINNFLHRKSLKTVAPIVPMEPEQTKNIPENALSK